MNSQRVAVLEYSVTVVRDYVQALRARVDVAVAAAEALRGRELRIATTAPSSVAFRALSKLWSRAAAGARRDVQELLDAVAEQDTDAGRRLRECVFDEIFWLVADVDLPPGWVR